MSDFYYYSYLSLLSIAFILSVWCKKSDRHLKIFPVLLFFSVLAEAIVYLLVFVLNIKPEYMAVYHVYIPIEYALLSLYFARSIPGRYTMVMYFGLLIIVTSVCIYLPFTGGLFTYPGIHAF